MTGLQVVHSYKACTGIIQGKVTRASTLNHVNSDNKYLRNNVSK